MTTLVIGGGLSGLSVAHRLLELDPSHDVRVLEASARVGGWLDTVERDGFIIETGPDSIVTDKPAALALVRRLGLEGEVIRTRKSPRGAYVVRGGRLVKVPAGFSLMAPTQLMPWATTPAVSLRAKLRAGMDLFFRPQKRPGEQSVAEFVRRHFGPEILDRLAQPLVAGIYGGDPERLSLNATMPRFIDMERQSGSVVRAMLARARGDDGQSDGARYGLFVAFRRGMRTLIDGLSDRLEGRIELHQPVVRVAKVPDGFLVETAAGQRREAQNLVLALPAWASGELLAPVDAELSRALGAIAYGSAATVTMAWPREAIPHPLAGFGFVVPSIEKRRVLAATFSSVKWEGRAPEGQALIRVFVGGTHAPALASLSDSHLCTIAREELAELLGVVAPPTFSLVRRYERAMPQYHVGHLDRAQAVEARQAATPGLHVVGNALRGVGIPDTIRYAEAAAERISAG